MFVPVAEAQLLDTWHVRGMRGTGTHHFAVDNVFVPAERTVLSATAPLLEDRAALPHPAHAAVRLGRRVGGVRHGALVPEHVHGPGRRQGPARDAGVAARSVDGAGDDRPVRGVAAHRQGVPERGRPRHLERGVREHGHARSPREPAPGHHARHPTGRADRRRRLQRGRRDRRLRGQRPAALLPGHARDHPAHAEPALALRAGRAVLAGTARSTRTGCSPPRVSQPRCSFRPRSSAATRSRTG